jgi:hypothetical protein
MMLADYVFAELRRVRVGNAANNRTTHAPDDRTYRPAYDCTPNGARRRTGCNTGLCVRCDREQQRKRGRTGHNFDLHREYSFWDAAVSKPLYNAR